MIDLKLGMLFGRQWYVPENFDKLLVIAVKPNVTVTVIGSNPHVNWIGNAHEDWVLRLINEQLSWRLIA